MKINWVTGKRKVSELKHWEENPRKITPQKLEELKEKIKERGFHDVLKLDEDGMILSGNMRKEALEQLGIEEVNVLVPDRALTTEEKILIGIESNIQAGEFDNDILKGFGSDILFEAGISDKEISDIFNNVENIEDDFNEKKAKEIAQKNIVIKNGEVWKLGEHRLMCGSCLEPADMAKLMGDEKALMIYSDPPYNIGLDYSKGVGTKGKYDPGHVDDEKNAQFSGGKNDNKSIADYKEFLGLTMQNSLRHAEKDAHVFYWCDERFIWTVQGLYEELGVDNKRVCLWVKDHFMPTPHIAFNKLYEPCVYGVRGRPFLNKGINNLSEILNRNIGTGNDVFEDIMDLFNLWMVKRDNTMKYEHPTQKPVILHEKALKRCSKPGSVVIDSFGGSGSTLIACEQLKRRAFLMEVNPTFAQVILNRYREFTGDEPVRISE